MLGVIDNVEISCVAAAVSRRRVSVEERCSEFLPPKKAARMARGTGIVELSIAEDDVFSSDLCYAAAARVFSEEIRREDIGAVIFISQMPDSMVPATSFYLQHRLGLPSKVVAFDVTQGCSGFAYGVYIAASLVSNLHTHVLLCCGDIGSRGAYPQDTSLFAIVGDAGSAAIISPCPVEKKKKLYFNIDSFGERTQVLFRERSGYRSLPLTDSSGRLTLERSNYSVMDGMGIMDFSLHDTPANINNLLQYAQLSIERLDIAIVHQAQKLIVESLADKLGLPREKVPFKSGHIGNTDMATIPVCLTELKKDGEYYPWHTVLLSGFGVGLSVASLIADLSETKVLETIEI